MASQQFDPTSIAKFSVIRIPYSFERERSLKFFAVICHHGIYAMCLKATSKVTIYKNNPDMMKGCVYYPAGTCACFSMDTAVQPDNQIPIAHEHILNAHLARELAVHPPLPNFEQELRRAIRDSVTLDERRRERLLAVI